ncbi:hypothetical protein ACVW0V_009373 [Bradyrhizobium elkanii]
MSSTLGATHRSMKSASPEIRQHCRKRGTAATAASNASIALRVWLSSWISTKVVTS